MLTENALLRMTKLRSTQKPSPRDFELLKIWLTLPDGGDNFLDPAEYGLWKLDHSNYVSLADFEQRDIFSQMMYGGVLKVYHELWGKRKKVITRQQQKEPTTAADPATVERSKHIVEGVRRRKDRPSQ
jgi:hypothetical protein